MTNPLFRSVDAHARHVFACLNRPLPIELLQASVLQRGLVLSQSYENDFLFSWKWNSLSLEKFSTKHGIKSEGFWHWEMAYFLFPFSFKLLSRMLCTKQHIVCITNFFAVVVIISYQMAEFTIW